MKKTKEAFLWIIGILKKGKVPYLISGGLAARVYGSLRHLADIDIEIPNEYFGKILSAVKRYSVYGPKRYKDKNWDIFLLTLRYHGQLIDLSGIESGKIFDKRKNKWVKMKTDISNYNRRMVYGRFVNVSKKKDLIAYKKIIGRKVDLEDIKQIS